MKFKKRICPPGLFGAILLIVLALSGCGLIGNGSSGGSDLEVQKRIWKNYSTGSYSFTLTRSCFCMYAGEFEITVRLNQIVEIVPPSWWTQGPIPQEDYQYFQTVDDLFTTLENAYRDGADSLQVEYADDGYPTDVTIDYWKQAVDDEIFYSVRNLVMSDAL